MKHLVEPGQRERGRVSPNTLEPLRTVHQVANLYNIPIWKLRRFIKTGAVPLYRVGNGRILIRASEFIAAVEASAVSGGAK